jgi:hypothetical protein
MLEKGYKCDKHISLLTNKYYLIIVYFVYSLCYFWKTCAYYWTNEILFETEIKTCFQKQIFKWNKMMWFIKENCFSFYFLDSLTQSFDGRKQSLKLLLHLLLHSSIYLLICQHLFCPFCINTISSLLALV